MKKSEVATRDLRVFGLVWSIILTIIAIKSTHVIIGLLALIFLFISVFYPQFYWYSGIYYYWVKLGNFLGKINGTIISFILFYAIFTPVGIALRLFKKDLLSKKLNHAASTYFIDRKVQPQDMRNQF